MAQNTAVDEAMMKDAQKNMEKSDKDITDEKNAARQPPGWIGRKPTRISL